MVTYETLPYQFWSERGNDNTRVVRAFVKELRDNAADTSWIFNARGVARHAPDRVTR